jgi:hypothetical protein
VDFDGIPINTPAEAQRELDKAVHGRRFGLIVGQLGNILGDSAVRDGVTDLHIRVPAAYLMSNHKNRIDPVNPFSRTLMHLIVAVAEHAPHLLQAVSQDQVRATGPVLLDNWFLNARQIAAITCGVNDAPPDPNRVGLLAAAFSDTLHKATAELVQNWHPSLRVPLDGIYLLWHAAAQGSPTLEAAFFRQPNNQNFHQQLLASAQTGAQTGPQTVGTPRKRNIYGQPSTP